MNSEPLANLERIGLLDPVPFSAALMQKMLNVAQSRLEDAMRQDNSMETRFDCAYTAIRAVADAALLKRATEPRRASRVITRPHCSVWSIH